MSIDFFIFSSKVVEMLMKYFRAAFMELKIGNYTNKCQSLEVSNRMGCVISPFQWNILRVAADAAKGLMTKEKKKNDPSSLQILHNWHHHSGADELLQRIHSVGKNKVYTKEKRDLISQRISQPYVCKPYEISSNLLQNSDAFLDL